MIYFLDLGDQASLTHTLPPPCVVRGLQSSPSLPPAGDERRGWAHTCYPLRDAVRGAVITPQSGEAEFEYGASAVAEAYRQLRF